MPSKMHSDGFLGAHVGRSWRKPEPAPLPPAAAADAKEGDADTTETRLPGR